MIHISCNSISPGKQNQTIWI